MVESAEGSFFFWSHDEGQAKSLKIIIISTGTEWQGLHNIVGKWLGLGRKNVFAWYMSRLEDSRFVSHKKVRPSYPNKIFENSPPLGGWTGKLTTGTDHFANYYYISIRAAAYAAAAAASFAVSFQLLIFIEFTKACWRETTMARKRAGFCSIEGGWWWSDEIEVLTCSRTVLEFLIRDPWITENYCYSYHPEGSRATLPVSQRSSQPTNQRIHKTLCNLLFRGRSVGNGR